MAWTNRDAAQTQVRRDLQVDAAPHPNVRAGAEGVPARTAINGSPGTPDLVATITDLRVESIAAQRISLLLEALADPGFRVVADPDDAVLECDETNNDDDWADTFCP